MEQGGGWRAPDIGACACEVGVAIGLMTANCHGIVHAASRLPTADDQGLEAGLACGCARLPGSDSVAQQHHGGAMADTVPGMQTARTLPMLWECLRQCS